MDDAVRYFHIVCRRQFLFRRDQEVKQFRERQAAAIEMHLQRTDAGCEIDDTGDVLFLHPAHQRVHAKAQVQVQHQRSVFDQQVAVAALPIDHLW